MGEAPFLIGRHPACDLLIDDLLVSRHHASIRKEGAQWILEDAGSRHGTWLDGERLQGAVPLRPGQCIRIGSVEIRVVANEPERRQRRATAQGILRKRRGTDPTPQAAPVPGFGLSEVSQIEAILMSGRRLLEQGQPDRLAPLLHALRSSVHGGLGQPPPSAPLLHALGDFALTVAERHGLTEWLDGWLEVLGVAHRIPAAGQVETLEALVRRGVRPRPESFADALSRLQAAADVLGPSEQQRLDALAALHGGRFRRVVRRRLPEAHSAEPSPLAGRALSSTPRSSSNR